MSHSYCINVSMRSVSIVWTALFLLLVQVHALYANPFNLNPYSDRTGDTYLVQGEDYGYGNLSDQWLLSRWSWLHYWESRRFEYLSGAESVPAQVAGNESAVVLKGPNEELRASAVAVLRNALQDNRPRALRSAATLALGKIADSEAGECLVELTHDKKQQIRELAWLGLGLQDAGAGRTRMMNPGMLKEPETVAWIAGAGLMKDPPDEVMKLLFELVQQDKSIDVSRMALWALRQQLPPGDASRETLSKLARYIMLRSQDTLMVGEAMQLLGACRDDESILKLRQIYTRPKQGCLPSSKFIWKRGHPRPGAVVFTGYYEELAGLRSAAALALSQYELPERHPDGRAARKALRSLFDNPPRIGSVSDLTKKSQRGKEGWPSNGVVSFEIRFAVLGLGRIGYASDARIIIQELRAKTLDNPIGIPFDSTYFQRRSYAALGLGYYLQRNNGQDVPKDTQDEIDEALKALVEVGSDPNEPDNLRAACLLALGMSGSADRKEEVRTILRATPLRDRLVIAFGAMALAMLHTDAQEVIGLVEPMLQTQPVASLNLDDLLSRRFKKTIGLKKLVQFQAMIRALTMVNNPDAVDLMRSHFGRETWASMEIVRGMRQCHAYDLAAPLTQMIQQYLDTPDTPLPDNADANTDKADVSTDEMDANTDKKVKQPIKTIRLRSAVIAVWCLGELLRGDSEDRLGRRMLGDCNYTLPFSPRALTREQDRTVSHVGFELDYDGMNTYLLPVIPPHWNMWTPKIDPFYHTKAMFNRFRCYADPLLFEMYIPLWAQKPSRAGFVAYWRF